MLLIRPLYSCRFVTFLTYSFEGSVFLLIIVIVCSLSLNLFRMSSPNNIIFRICIEHIYNIHTYKIHIYNIYIYNHILALSNGIVWENRWNSDFTCRDYNSDSFIHVHRQLCRSGNYRPQRSRILRRISEVFTYLFYVQICRYLYSDNF